MNPFLTPVLLLFNAAGLVLMYADKRLAVHRRRRIPEATLLLTALFGGAAGCLLGMLLFWHKVRNPLFAVGLPLLLSLQLLALFYLT